jgi:hypothetical protein
MISGLVPIFSLRWIPPVLVLMLATAFTWALSREGRR